jgi:hypothetical protein
MKKSISSNTHLKTWGVKLGWWLIY